MALFNPFCKCLNPQRIVNPYTHECMTVPCGKCKACILAKNSRYAFQCDLESYCSMYTVFVTLTYAPNYLPVATPMYLGDNTDFGLLCRYDLVDFETGESLGVFESESSQLELLQQKFNLCGSIPYLRKTDLQLFLKRFRYYVTKRLPKEKVRYYAVGEYGPVHFRPHYHLQRLGQGFLQGERSKVYELTPRDFIKRSLVLNGKYKEFDVWRSAYSYFYPKCLGYIDKSAHERAYSYRTYDTARHLFPSCETTFALAKEVATF